MIRISLSATAYTWYIYKAATETPLIGYHKTYNMRLNKGDKIAVREMPSGEVLLYQEGEEKIKFRLPAEVFAKLKRKLEPFSGKVKEDNAPIVATPASDKTPNSQPPVIRLTVSEAKKKKNDPTAYVWYKYVESRRMTIKDHRNNEICKLEHGDKFGLLTADPEKGGFFMEHDEAKAYVVTADVLSKLDLIGNKVRLPAKFKEKVEPAETTETAPTSGGRASTDTTNYIIGMKETVADILAAIKELRKMSVSSMEEYSEYADKLRSIRDDRIYALKDEMKENKVSSHVATTIISLLKENYESALDVLRQKKKHHAALTGKPEDTTEETTETTETPTVRISRDNASKFAEIGGVKVGNILNLPDDFKERLNEIIQRNLEDKTTKRRIKAILDEAAGKGLIEKVEPPKPAPTDTKPATKDTKPAETKPEDTSETFNLGGGGNVPVKYTKTEAIKEMKKIADDGSEIIDSKIRDFQIATDIGELDELYDAVQGTYDTYSKAAEGIVNTSKATKKDMREAIEKLLNIHKKAKTLYAERKKVLEALGVAPTPVVTEPSDEYSPLVDEDGEPLAPEVYSERYLKLLTSVVSDTKPYMSLTSDNTEAVKDVLAELDDHNISKTDAAKQLQDILDSETAKPTKSKKSKKPDGDGDERERVGTREDYASLLGDDFDKEDPDDDGVQEVAPANAPEASVVNTGKYALTKDDIALITKVGTVPGELYVSLPDDILEQVKDSLSMYRNGRLTDKQLLMILEDMIDLENEREAKADDRDAILDMEDQDDYKVASNEDINDLLNFQFDD